jgi:type IX secretion system substrate protein
MKSIAVIVLLLCCTSSLLSQPWTATHERDTSSFFPLGFYTFYISREVPPFSYDPETGYPPSREDMKRWVSRDSANVHLINANYFVDWIPNVYWHLVDKGPPVKRDVVPFEDDIFREFALSSGFRMDYKNNAPWLDQPGHQASVQEMLQVLPQKHPPRSITDNNAWAPWQTSVRNELLRLRDEVFDSTVAASPYLTFYASHEVDVYPDLRDNMGVITDEGRASRYALQFICHSWDELQLSPEIKPFIVSNALVRWPKLIAEIASTCRNLRMIAMDAYVLDPYVMTTYATPSESSPYKRGQRFVFRDLADRMTSFWKAFEIDIPFYRKLESLPIERWFIGQSCKSYDADSTGRSLTGADFDWNNQNETRASQNGAAKRYPTYLEIRLQASLALSRGFKGILWYTYGSYNPTPLRDAPYGVVDYMRRPIQNDLDLGMHPKHPCPSQVRPFDNTARVNREIAEIGPLYRNLNLRSTFRQDSIPPNHLGLISVEATGPFGGEVIDVSVFKHLSDDSTWYVMAVNTLLNDSDDPCAVAKSKTITFTFDHRNQYTLIDEYNGKSIVSEYSNDKQHFRDELEPGQGKLYRIKNTDTREFHIKAPPPIAASIGVYPNPADTEAMISFDLPEDSHVRIRLFTLSGSEVTTIVDGPRAAGYYRHELTLSQLADGVYFLEMQTSNGTSAHRFIISH